MNRVISIIWFIVLMAATFSLFWLMYLIWKERPLDLVDRVFITFLLTLNIIQFWTFKK